MEASAFGIILFLLDVVADFSVVNMKKSAGLTVFLALEICRAVLLLSAPMPLHFEYLGLVWVIDETTDLIHC